MRNSKRALAGVAAAAIGVGGLAFVAAPSANATTFGTASAVAFDYPSLTLAVDAWAAGTGIDLPISVVDSAGTVAANTDAIGAGRSVTVTVTNPAGVPSSFVAVTPNDEVYDSTATANDLAGFQVDPYADWADFAIPAPPDPIALGTYTVTAKLINTANGAVLSSDTLPFTVTTVAGAAAPRLTFHNAFPALNPINAYGATAGNTYTTGDLFVSMTNGTGGPFVAAMSTALGGTTVSFSSTNLTLTSLTNDPAGTPTENGVFPIDGTGTWAGSRDTVAASWVVNTTVGSRASLPVAIGNKAAPSTTAVELLTEPQAESADSGVLAVLPAGTQQVSFLVASTPLDDSTRLAYNAVSSAGVLGGVSASGGVIGLSNTVGSLTLALNAAAAAGGETLDVSFGTGETYTIEFATPAAGIFADASLGKVGSAVPVAGGVTTQFGAAVGGTWTVTMRPTGFCYAPGTPLATATTGADGAFKFDVPAAASPASAGTATFDLCATNGSQQLTAAPLNVTYTATGEVASLTLTNDGPVTGIPVLSTPTSGVVVLDNPTDNSVLNPADADVTAAGTTTMVDLTATSSPATVVTYKASEGAHLTTKQIGSVTWNQGVSEVSVASGTPVAVFATKPGTHTITVSAGATSKTFTFIADVPWWAGRTISVTPAKTDIAPLTSLELTAEVKDIYGNGVPGAPVTYSGSGAIAQNANLGETNAEGKLKVFFVSGQARGEGIATFALEAWVADAVPGSPALARTATSTVTVTPAAERSIAIVGTRGTVSGKSGIIVEGMVTGIENGKTVTPFIRFPGQTTFSAGTARPVIEAGEFSWQRKTGKRVTVYVTSEGVTSNRVTIQAS